MRQTVAIYGIADNLQFNKPAERPANVDNEYFQQLRIICIINLSTVQFTSSPLRHSLFTIVIDPIPNRNLSRWQHLGIH